MGTSVTLTISITQDGKINVIGPLHDKVLCYGLLEAARDVVRDFKAPTSDILLVKPQPKI